MSQRSNDPNVKQKSLYGTTLGVLFYIHDILANGIKAARTINNQPEIPIYVDQRHHLGLIETDEHIVFALAPLPHAMLEVKILTDIRMRGGFVGDRDIDNKLEELAGVQNKLNFWVNKQIILNNQKLLQSFVDGHNIEQAIKTLDTPFAAELSNELKRSVTECFERCQINHILKK